MSKYRWLRYDMIILDECSHICPNQDYTWIDGAINVISNRRERQTERQRDKQRDRKRDKQRDREAEGQTERATYIYRERLRTHGQMERLMLSVVIYEKQRQTETERATYIYRERQREITYTWIDGAINGISSNI